MYVAAIKRKVVPKVVAAQGLLSFLFYAAVIKKGYLIQCEQATHLC